MQPNQRPNQNPLQYEVTSPQFDDLERLRRLADQQALATGVLDRQPVLQPANAEPAYRRDVGAAAQLATGLEAAQQTTGDVRADLDMLQLYRDIGVIGGNIKTARNDTLLSRADYAKAA